MPRKNILAVFMVLLILILACSLPSTPTDSSQATENTAIAKTVEAAENNNSVATPRPSKTPSGAGGVQSNRPTPTAIPTKPAPTTSASAASSSTSISIGNLNFSPNNTVYYGNCSAGEETSIHIEVAISPLDQVKEVHLWYDIIDSTGIVSSGWEKMTLLGIGDYAADIDMGQLAPQVLVDPDGTFSFGVEATNKSGDIFYSNGYTLSIWDCGGILGPPPGGGEADIRYFTGPASVTAGEILQLEWDVWSACKVFLDGNEVQHTDMSLDPVPANEGDTTYTYTLTTWGDTCDNNSEKIEQVSITINAAGGSGNNGGDANIQFVNNSSHPIVELIIDGTEVILTESQTLLPYGGSLDVQGVSAGNHNYSPGAGFWSGGIKNAIYPMPSGSFSDQSGTVTINDPSITQLMTNYGFSGYFGGAYWDNTTLHCAAFTFYEDGTFTFYIDGNVDDDGTYFLEVRSPDLYSVDFSVLNSANSEQFIGTYSYTGAAAGTMYMYNGPAGWKQIDYIYNGGC